MMSKFDAKMIFGDNLKKCMEDARITQRELAEETGISQPTISRYINGDQLPSFEAIINMSEVLCCDYNELIGYGDYDMIEW